MLAVLLLEKGQKLCSIPQIMPKIMLAQSARAYRCIDQFSNSRSCHASSQNYINLVKYRNTVRKIGKSRNTVSTIDEIPIPHLFSVLGTYQCPP